MDERVLANFLAPDESLRTIPAKRAKLLTRFHPDCAALRRYLVVDEFLTREHCFYWRNGGTVDV
ncbi:hypothetical protein NPS01_05400 [Nocardioides psychrotolerans]|uniref:DUF2087 domain-containing protein n=1 Tax=Nocardioides psychrotolerans TaxID=1005945 RepID=A0A1I3CSB0_9ACTN|nr:DUF2087 domain-containing protein [Nocardioides psychrotolerans]GEP36877.1 hypothetical protein NPS01_05400 [Nocardioides psychrotolerans]SFH77149.1 hypothetical protein SAMN05216561_102190 [Nocardioides psychrotolerans]